MRAVNLQDLVVQEEYLLSGDLLHHLVQVVRIQVQEEILLLNGDGLQVKAAVIEVSKRVVRLKKISESTVTRKLSYDLALGIPKKEALELTLKEAVELGFRRIYLVRGAFSQNRVPERERIKSLLVSALEQSNAPFLPEVMEAEWGRFPWNDYGTVLVFDSQMGSARSPATISSPVLLVIGPEGGFSHEESDLFRAQKNAETILLPVPILRTPTAVATGAGLLLQRLMS